MTKFVEQTFVDGEVINNGNISTLSNNDDANYAVLYDRPRGVIFNRRGYSEYNNSYDYISTVLDSVHHATSGTSTSRPVKVSSATIPIEPNRRYYIEFQACFLFGTGNNNAPAILLSVDGAFKTGQIAHVPVARAAPRTTPNGYPAATSLKTWYIYDTLQELQATSIQVDCYIQQKFPSSTSILSLYAQADGGPNNFFLRVEDWGSVLSSELEV